MKIKATKREIKDNPKRIRKAGGVPAVLYGHKIANLNLTLDGKTFGKVYKTAGEATILNVEIEGDKTDRNVLVHDVTYDPVSGEFIHVDLYQVRMDEKITTHIPLAFEGEADAVKTGKGVLVKNIYELEIESLPADLPHDIKVDISKLATFDDVITVSDLKAPAGVKIIADMSAIIAKVAPPRAEEAETEAPTMSVEDIKVETEEKKKEREAAKAQAEKEE